MELFPGGTPVNHVAHPDEINFTGMGTGAAWFDANADGNLDLYVTNRYAANLLYISDGKGGFVESAAAFGLADVTGDGAGVAVADFNNDGFRDIYLANSKADRLFRNDGGTGFTNITVSAGIDATDESRGTSASWGDFNDDGYVDLYVANHLPKVDAHNASKQDHLYVNNGDETFTDVSNVLSETGNLDGLGFIGAWTDYDQDGDLDIILINDCVVTVPVSNQLFRNDGDTHPTLMWKFTEISAAADVDSCNNGMGIAFADYNRDGNMDFYYSNIGPAVLMQNTGSGFMNSSSVAKVDSQPWPLFSWGTSFFDANLDGWPDLFLALGSLHYAAADDSHHHSNMFFLNNANGTDFSEHSVEYALKDSMRARTVIAGDYDDDGDPDLAIVAYNEEIVIKRNDVIHGNHFLKVDLEGTESNRDGIGARIRVLMGDGTWQSWEVRSGSSLGGGEQITALFGLGGMSYVDSLLVHWPSGAEQLVTNITADQTIRIVEFDHSSSTIDFEDRALALGIDATCGTCGLGNGVSFVDFNGDGWDDLSFGTQTGDSALFYRNDEGSFTKLPALIPTTDKQETLLWFDSDNDGDLDLFVTHFEGPNKYFENTGDLNLIDKTTDAGFPTFSDPSYGVVAGDYDLDGDLDLYVANWSYWPIYPIDFTNYLYKNNGDGTFTDVTVFAGVGDGDELTFCSAFFDFDNDGWPDLYNSQDRPWSNNSMFKNNGDGTFTDVSGSSGTGIGIDAMNVGVGDYNNDEQMDIYITNGPNGNVFFKNNGNETFSDVADQTGTRMHKSTWGGNFVDVDLDSDLDLYVSAMHARATSASDLFINQFPTDTFYTLEPPGMTSDTISSFANAVADFNRDGYPDFAVNNDADGVHPNKFHLWESLTQTNNRWLKVNLHGIESNRFGVGSKIEYFLGGTKLVRYTHCGIAYLAQNSYTEHLGTGTNYMVDSLKVFWPNGHVTKLYDIVTGQTLEVFESDVLFVDVDATGIGSGLSWVDAFTSLGEAIEFASESHIRKIWIAEGTYTPAVAGRDSSFIMFDGLEIYGGFEGTEDSLTQRNVDLYVVSLSGDIGVPMVGSDNAYHVVVVPKDVSECKLSGITISQGQADGVDLNQHGGGILCLGSARAEDVVLADCYSSGEGAAIYGQGWKSYLQVSYVTLESNSSPTGMVVVSRDLSEMLFNGENEIKN